MGYSAGAASDVAWRCSQRCSSPMPPFRSPPPCKASSTGPSSSRGASLCNHCRRASKQPLVGVPGGGGALGGQYTCGAEPVAVGAATAECWQMAEVELGSQQASRPGARGGRVRGWSCKPAAVSQLCGDEMSRYEGAGKGMIVSVLVRAVPMQTPLIESKPQRLHHKKLYFPTQSVLLWFIWPTCLSHIHFLFT
jgi:hypothetical protein